MNLAVQSVAAPVSGSSTYMYLCLQIGSTSHSRRYNFAAQAQDMLVALASQASLYPTTIFYFSISMNVID